MRKILGLLLFILLLAGCNGANTGSVATGDSDTLISRAELLTMIKTEGYTLVTISDPWHEGATLRTYVLVHRDSVMPGNLPEGTVIRVPIERAIVYSAVHTAVMSELGGANAVKGVTDAQFFTDSLVTQGLANGTITDCGSSMTPLVEKVIDLDPDAILLSPYQDGQYGQITKLNIPIVECADYMETTPLGRAEWIKFYGALLDRDDLAKEIFSRVVARYDSICSMAQTGLSPTVLTETVISGVWNVPGGNSYMARLLTDAGGKYPWASDTHTGSLNLDFNQVLDRAHNADVWLVKSFNIHSLDDLLKAYELNSEFDAFKTGNVYACDTGTTHLFEIFPFHPETLLEEYYNIFNGNTDRCKFYEKLK